MRSSLRKKIFLASLLLGLLPLALSAAPATPTPNPLTKKIQRILDFPELREAQVGISIISLTQKKTIFEHNGDMPLNPASNLKVLTSWVALKELGPYYRFETKFYSDHSLNKGALQQLYIRGSGDPYLVIERLWRIAGDLYMKGLRSIDGDIIVDGSFFDDDLHTDHWPDEPGPQAYFAPTAALAVNFNTVAFYIRPGKKPGDEPEVTMDPNIQAIQYRMEARTSNSFSKKSISIVRDPAVGGDLFHIRGQIPVDYALRKPLYRNIRLPLIYAGDAFRFVMENRGIKIKGKVRVGKVPSGATEIFTEKSPPLGSLLQYVNKNSNNFMAEQILKTLAAEIYKKPGRTDDGVEILAKHLLLLGFKSEEFHLENGSGLSHENRIPARALVRVLEEAWNDPTLAPEYLASMALGGFDGTLEDRQQNDTFQTAYHSPRIRAKTGSLRGVSCITGYLTRADGETLGFSIMMNHLRKSFDSEYHDIQDRILKELADYRS